jgi:hypothetical protein
VDLAGEWSRAAALLVRPRSVRGGTAPRHRHRCGRRDTGARAGRRHGLVRGHRPDRRSHADDPDLRRVCGHPPPSRIDRRRARNEPVGRRRRRHRRAERRRRAPRALRVSRRSTERRSAGIRRPPPPAPGSAADPCRPTWFRRPPAAGRGPCCAGAGRSAVCGHGARGVTASPGAACRCRRCGCFTALDARSSDAELGSARRRTKRRWAVGDSELTWTPGPVSALGLATLERARLARRRPRAAADAPCRPGHPRSRPGGAAPVRLVRGAPPRRRNRGRIPVPVTCGGRLGRSRGPGRALLGTAVEATP